MIRNLSSTFADSTPDTQASAAKGRQRALKKGSGGNYEPELFPMDEDRQILLGKSRLFAPLSKERITLELMVRAIDASSGQRAAVITAGSVIKEMKKRGAAAKSYRSANYFLRAVNERLRSAGLCLMSIGRDRIWNNKTEIVIHRVSQRFIKA